MNLMFWKKKAASGDNTESESADKVERESAALESSGDEAPAKPGVAARLKMQLAALVQRFKGKPAFSAEEEPEPDAHGHSESDSEGEPQIRPVNLKKRLIIGGAVGLLVLLLGGTVFAILKIFMQPQPNEDVPAIAETPRNVRPVPRTEQSQAEIEALKKKNLELQAQIEALKKKPSLPPPSTAEPAGQQTSHNAVQPNSESADLTINSQDPQAAAMSLKEAIEAMNESAGGRTKKNAK